MRDVRTLTDIEIDQVAAGSLISISGGDGGTGGAGGSATASTTTTSNTNTLFGVNKSYTKTKVYAYNKAVGGDGGSANGGSVYLKFW
jgi:hypothetical protein